MSKNVVVKLCCHGNVNVDVHMTTTLNKIFFYNFFVFKLSAFLPGLDSARFPDVKLK